MHYYVVITLIKYDNNGLSYNDENVSQNWSKLQSVRNANNCYINGSADA